MVSFYEPPMNEFMASLLVLVGVYSAVRGVRRLIRGLDLAKPLEIVRGIRDCVLAFVGVVFTIGVLLGEAGFLILGAIVLAEELYETGLLVLVIRFGEGTAPEDKK